MKKLHKISLVVIGVILLIILLYAVIMNNKQESPIIKVGPDGVANMDAKSDPVISTTGADLQ